MKKLHIGTKLAFVFLFCIIFLTIIGAVAIVNIAKITGNITGIKLCKDIEIQILECRRQEKNILLLGPYERSTLEGEEEKTYLEKINSNLITLRGLVEEGKKRITIMSKEEFNAIIIELDNYKIYLKKVEDNFGERKSIIQSLETNFEELEKLSQIQGNVSEKIAAVITEAHIQTHHYITHHNNEFITKIKSDLAALKEFVEDEKIISFIDEHLNLINRLIENSKVFEAEILSMRKSGRKMQQIALNIIGVVENRIYGIERETTVSVRMMFILSVFFVGIIGIFFVRSITEPIRKLVKATVVIAKGDLSHRVEIESTDEVGELAWSFNKMIENLEKVTVSKEHVDNILESMMDSLIVFGPDGEIRQVNKSACELLGYREEEIVGMPSRQLFEREIPFEGAKLNKLVETGYLRNYELICLSKDKVNIPILFNASIMRNSEGGIAGIIGVIKDIRELKNLQEKLVRTESLAALGRFSSIIGHEFKNELCVMRNSVYFLGIKLQDSNEKVKKHIGILDKEISEAEMVIDNIISFAKNKSPEFKPVNLEGLLSAAIKKVQIPDTINIVVKTEKNLPPVQVDEVQFVRVFSNIILNSMQAMTGKGSLIIKVKRLEDYVNVVFEDTGSGIKEEDKEKIFDPFFSTKTKGMGLGLTISKVIIESHNGTFDIVSEVDKGTTVTIKLPI